MLLEFISSEGHVQTIDTEAELIFDNTKEDLLFSFAIFGKEKEYEQMRIWGIRGNEKAVIKQALINYEYYDNNGVKYTITKESKQEIERNKQKSNNLFWSIFSLIFGMLFLLLISLL